MLSIVICPPRTRRSKLIPFPRHTVWAPLITGAQASIAISHAAVLGSGAIIWISSAASMCTSAAVSMSTPACASEPAGYFGLGMRGYSIQDRGTPAPMNFGVGGRVIASRNKSPVGRLGGPLADKSPVFCCCITCDIDGFVWFDSMATGRFRRIIVLIYLSPSVTGVQLNMQVGLL